METHEQSAWSYPQSFDDLYAYLDLKDKTFWLAVFFTFWTPFFWNVVS